LDLSACTRGDKRQVTGEEMGLPEGQYLRKKRKVTCSPPVLAVEHALRRGWGGEEEKVASQKRDSRGATAAPDL